MAFLPIALGLGSVLGGFLGRRSASRSQRRTDERNRAEDIAAKRRLFEAQRGQFDASELARVQRLRDIQQLLGGRGINVPIGEQRLRPLPFGGALGAPRDLMPDPGAGAFWNLLGGLSGAAGQVMETDAANKRLDELLEELRQGRSRRQSSPFAGYSDFSLPPMTLPR